MTRAKDRAARMTLRSSNNQPHDDDLPTARTTFVHRLPARLCTGYLRLLVFCNSCRHQAEADLQAIVESGRGDVPLTELQFRCSQCGTDRTNSVVTSRHNQRPW